MKKMLFLTIIFIAVPSFFILTKYEEETVSKQFFEEKVNNSNETFIKVKQTNKNKITGRFERKK